MRVRGKAVVSVLVYLVVLFSSLAVRIDVDHDPAEVRQVAGSLRRRVFVVATKQS